MKNNAVYLRCSLSKTGCKGTAKLKLETNSIYPNSTHSHGLDELKTKCKKRAQTSQNSLRKFFDNETRTSLFAYEVSFNECERSMYRSRRSLQTKILFAAVEFATMLSESAFASHHKFAIMTNNHTAVIFFSDQMKNTYQNFRNSA